MQLLIINSTFRVSVFIVKDKTPGGHNSSKVFNLVCHFALGICFPDFVFRTRCTRYVLFLYPAESKFKSYKLSLQVAKTAIGSRL